MLKMIKVGWKENESHSITYHYYINIVEHSCLDVCLLQITHVWFILQEYSVK